MAQGNLGYKSGKAKFSIHEIISDLRNPQRGPKWDIDLEDMNDPKPALHYLITFAMGCKRYLPEITYWDAKLTSYLRRLNNNGWSTRKINGMVLSIMNKMNLEVEIYRCFGGRYLR